MKKLSKVLVTAAVAVMMCFILVGCGEIKIDDIKGDWTLDTIDGKPLSEIASGTGVDEGMLAVNWTIKEDKTITSTNATSSEEFTMELKSNGFEVKEKGKSEVFFSVEYDKSKQTLSYKLNMSGTEATYVMKKGTAEIGASSDAEESEDAEAEEPSEGDDEEVVDDETDESEDESLDDSSDEGDEEGDYDEEGEEEYEPDPEVDDINETE